MMYYIILDAEFKVSLYTVEYLCFGISVYYIYDLVYKIYCI